MVSKEALKWAKTVAVEPSEILALPGKLPALIKGKAGAEPKVIVMNPSLTESYGVFNHEELMSKKWNAIFKEPKAGIRSAITAGSFVKPDKVVEISGSEVEGWESSAGTEMKAQLVAIEDDVVFVFKTEAGKTIRAKASQLSKKSVERAKALAKE